MKAGGWSARVRETALAVRITLAGVLFGLLVAGVASVLGYAALQRQLDARADEELRGKQQLLAHLLSEIADKKAISAHRHRFADLLIGHDSLHMAVLEARDGALLASFSPEAQQSVAQVETQKAAGVLDWRGSDGRRFASLAARALLQDSQPVQYVLSLDRTADHALLRGFARAALLAVPAVLVLVAIGAWTMTRTALAPLVRFETLATSITARSLARRIELPGLPRELRKLALDFNAMLDRMDDSVARLSEFSGDLAHELRTPVATTLGRTQVALARHRSAEELRQVLEGNVEELDRITRLIADMLLLARSDQGAEVLQREEVSLADEARRVAEFLAVIADERNVTIEISGEAVVSADRVLVQRAVTNLLTNAIRHSLPRGTIAVRVARDGSAVELSVSNRGPGIASDQLERVFERFVRLDASRVRSEGGAGLGLAIVKSIMKAHGGSVRADSEANAWTTFTLAFADAGAAMTRP